MPNIQALHEYSKYQNLRIKNLSMKYQVLKQVSNISIK